MSSADIEDPIEYFLQDIAYHGKTNRTKDAYGRVLREFEEFLDDPDRGPGKRSVSPADATRRHCMAWIHSLRGTVAASTLATYAAYLNRFYSYMTQVGVFESNPMTVVLQEMDERIDADPTRRDISIPVMRTFLGGISHPLDRALIVTFLKTGVRVGELCNLDLRDVRLETGEAGSEYELGAHPRLDGRTDSILVSSAPARGALHNGETRSATNKRERSTVVPVDGELKGALKRWLAIRPDTRSPAEPLFVGTGGKWGERLTPKAVRYIVQSHTEDAGWYRAGGDASENVTPHYFRHFFTTHLRDRTGDRGIVKYLRGDVADDILDTYTHNWGNRVRETYEEHIYSVR